MSHAARFSVAQFPSWVALLLGTVVASVALNHVLRSWSEVFWCLFPVWLLTATYGLRLIPFPKMTGTSRAARVATYCVLFFFPVLYYGFLVWVTESVWSWTELILCIYFFGISLECLLLVMFAAAERTGMVLQSRLPASFKWPVFLGQKLTTYALLFPFLLVVFAVHRPKLIPRPITPRPGETVESITFSARDGRELRGSFLSRSDPLGTIIVCHGVGANHADIQELFLPFYRTGYQILAFDFRGHGRSSGHTITYGLRERADVLGAYDYALSRTDVDSTKLFAIGYSMGGSALLQSLPEMPYIRAAVVDSAFASLEGMVLHQLRFFPSVARDPLLLAARGFAWLETGADIRELAPADRLDELNIPLLIIHGEADRIVPVEQAKILAKAATGPHQLVILRGVDHIGAMFMDEYRYLKRIKRHFHPLHEGDRRSQCMTAHGPVAFIKPC